MASKSINPGLATLEALKGAKVNSNIQQTVDGSTAPKLPITKSIIVGDSILKTRSFKISPNDEKKISKKKRKIEDIVKIGLSDNIIVRLAIERMPDDITSEELEAIRVLISQDKRRKK